MDTNEQPKKIGLVWPLIIVACVVGVVLVIALTIGRTVEDRADRINTLALIFVSGLTVSLMIVATSFPIRQWRRGAERPETVREIIRDGTQRVREIHYGAPPKYQIGEPTADPFAYPAMTRAMYQAGAAAQQHTSYTPLAPAQAAEWDLPPDARDGVNDVPPPAGWDGEIVM